MLLLALETSCDETSCALVELKNNTITVLSEETATSLALHASTGGIIPENAARAQIEYILPTITKTILNYKNAVKDNSEESFKKSQEFIKENIDGIAITYGPGLIGSLLIGVETAKTLSYVLDKPLYPVNHLLGHLYANYINRKLTNIIFPFVGLIVSGGHTDILLFNSHTNYTWLGGTRDDAAGEALDKIGRVLELPYPAGPEIERRASLVKKGNVKFHSPLINEDNFDFSFSGLKTEAIRFIQKNEITEELKNEICFATQKAIIDVVIKKTKKAAEQYNAKQILVGGGVSANSTLKNSFESIDLPILFPERKYSTDNGAMIGAYALVNPKEQRWEETVANPQLYFT